MSSLSQAKFWILLILSVPSIICSIFIFIYFYHKRRTISLDHHLTLVLVIASFLQMTINFAFIMDYYQHGTVRLGSDAFCTWWNWSEYLFNGLLLFAMAWNSVERHLLVFRRAIMATRRKRFFFHFLPISMACLYPAIYNFIVIVLNSCKNHWNYNVILCLFPCYFIDQPGVATYEFLGNIVFPILLIATANVCLILRVLWQKRRHHAAWRRQRKLTRQLVSIAILYMVFWSPVTVNGLIMTFIPSSILEELQVNYFLFLLYMIPILLPFISLISLSNFTKTVFPRQPRVIVPLIP